MSCNYWDELGLAIKKNVGDGLDVLKMNSTNSQELAELESECFKLAMSAQEFEKAITVIPAFISYGLRQRGVLISYISLYSLKDYAEIVNFGTKTAFRHKGYGIFLLYSVLDALFKESIEDVTLDVRVSNKHAISLYEKLGFQRVACRKNYYTEPDEDAWLFCLNRAKSGFKKVEDNMRTIIAANWKMYKTRQEALDFANDLTRRLNEHPIDANINPREVFLFVPFTAIYSASSGCAGGIIKVGAEDVYPAKEGAFTGEISPEMIKDSGANWVLTGHSERRHIIGESSDFVAQKTEFALESGLDVMICIGETIDERESGRLKEVLSEQISAISKIFKFEYAGRIAFAYEPVWAIGTGKVASNDDIVETHAIVRELMLKYLGECSSDIPILYGGSVKPGNAKSILSLDNVNGVLVGGASLKVDSFEQIIRA